MKCEICHKADAAAVIHRKENGETRELFVCRACAEAEARAPGKKRTPEKKPDVESISLDGGDGGEPPEFVKNLVDATLGFMKGVREDRRRRGRTCPKCRAKWETIKESGLVGCPECWRTFEAEIREEFLGAAYAPNHAGAMPPGVQGEDTRAFLERELKTAVEREDFRRAAELKRKIEALGGREEER